MRDRLRNLLDQLLLQDSFLSVSVLAGRIGAGVRTIFRDIQELECHLKEHGVTIEKKRSAGIRLVGDLSGLRVRSLSELPRLSWLTEPQRQCALLVFLGHKARVVKLNELATLFSVSDSCISTDLKEDDDFLRRHCPKAALSRLKGIGVFLEGDEWDVRMAVVRSAAMLFHPQELIQMLLFERENAKLEKMMGLLGFFSRKATVLQAIRDTEKRIGYRFSWYDLGLLFLYSLVALERKSIALKIPGAEFSGIPMSVSFSTAKLLWNDLRGTDSEAEGDEAEIAWLRGILSALEPGEIRETNRSHPGVSRIVSTMIAEIGNSKYFSYDFDSRLFTTLQVSLSSLVYKKIILFPLSPPLIAASTPKDGLDKTIFKILSPLLSEEFRVSIELGEIEPLCMAIRSSDGALSGIHPKLRILVTCFEGICLAQFIASTIRVYFQDVIVVASLSCDRISDEYLEENKIDLVITTFPAGLTAAPEYVVSTPFEIATFRKEIETVLADFESGDKLSSVGKANREVVEAGTNIDIALSILQRFTLTVMPEPIPESEITAILARAVLGNRKEYLRLKKDFDIRESFGAVVLEHSGIRFFHCRSSAVAEPGAGAIRVQSPRETFVYLVAPDPSTPEVIQALSKISVALMEDKDFTFALVNQGESEIKRRLLGFFASTL